MLIFDGSYVWKMFESKFFFEYMISLDEFVLDLEYNFLDDEDYDGDG